MPGERTDGLRVPGELQEELGAHEKGIEAAMRATRPFLSTWVRVDDRERILGEAIGAYLAATDLVPLVAVVEALRTEADRLADAGTLYDAAAVFRAKDALLARFGSTEGNDHE